jgi:hypothetical protein
MRSTAKWNLSSGASFGDEPAVARHWGRRRRSCLVPRDSAIQVGASLQSAGEQHMTDGDKIAAAVMATGLCSKVSASPDEYVKNRYLMLEKMQQDEGAAQQRRWNAPKGPLR